MRQGSPQLWALPKLHCRRDARFSGLAESHGLSPVRGDFFPPKRIRTTQKRQQQPSCKRSLAELSYCPSYRRPRSSCSLFHCEPRRRWHLCDALRQRTVLWNRWRPFSHEVAFCCWSVCYCGAARCLHEGRQRADVVQGSRRVLSLKPPDEPEDRRRFWHVECEGWGAFEVVQSVSE